MFQVRNLTTTLKKVIDETEKAAVFQTVKQRIAKTSGSSTDQLALTCHISMDEMDPKERLITDKNKLQQYRDARMRRNARQITYPDNPILFGKQRRLKKAKVFSPSVDHFAASDMVSQLDHSKTANAIFERRQTEAIPEVQRINTASNRSNLSHAGRNQRDKVIRSQKPLMYMDDFC